MRHVLVYGDSLSWGIVPGTRVRLPFEERWPGILEAKLNTGTGEQVRIVEDCLNGRRTVWEDPFKAGRNGFEGLAQRMEVNSPLSLVIVMLGTNDFQFCHQHSDAWSVAQGVARLVDAIRKAPIEPGMAVPPVLVVCPPPPHAACGSMTEKFRGAGERSAGLSEAYRRMAEESGCGIFDAGRAVRVSEVDGVHLDAEEHPKLADALVDVVVKLLGS
jgi:lysophospholipase L1-like esterase